MISSYAPFLVIGIATGSIYALAAMGLTVTFKTTGILNFGHGALAAAAAFVFYSLHEQAHVPWPVAFLASVGGFGVLGGLLLELLGRRLSTVSISNRIVATLGILLMVQGGATLLDGAQARPLKPYLPTGTIKVGSVFVGQDQLVAVVLAALTALGLAALFRKTRTGTHLRAVVDDSDLLGMTGVDPLRVRRTAWVLGATLASLSGVLIAPVLGLDATLLTLLVVQALGAAAVGRFTSIPLSYAGGLLLGVLQQLVGKWVGSNVTLASLPTAVPFLLLFVVLLATPRRMLLDVASKAQAGRRQVTVRARGRALDGLLVAVLVLAPAFIGAKTVVWTTGLLYAGCLLSLSLLVRLSGQVSLCQVGFMAVGAATFGHLAGDGHLPWLLAVLVAGLATVPFGALVAVPAMRLPALYLALATFGFGLLLEQVLYRTGLLFDGSAGVQAKRPVLLGIDFSSDRAYYYLVLAAFALAAALALGVERARLGRLLRALSDSPTALTTHGLATGLTRLIVFCLAAFLAGVFGALYVPLFGATNGDAFPSFTSLLLLAVLVVAGRGPLRPSLIGAFLFFIAPSYSSDPRLVQALPAVFGLAAVVVSLAGTGPLAAVQRLAASTARRTPVNPLSSRHLAHLAQEPA